MYVASWKNAWCLGKRPAISRSRKREVIGDTILTADLRKVILGNNAWVMVCTDHLQCLGPRPSACVKLRRSSCILCRIHSESLIGPSRSSAIIVPTLLRLAKLPATKKHLSHRCASLVRVGGSTLMFPMSLTVNMCRPLRPPNVLRAIGRAFVPTKIHSAD